MRERLEHLLGTGFGNYLDTLIRIRQRRVRGEQVMISEEEVFGEYPGLEIPVGALFHKEEMKEEDGRLLRLKSLAKENQKRLIVASTIAGITTVVVVSSLWMVRHILEKNPQADITDE